MWKSGFSLLAFSLSQHHTKKILQSAFCKPLEWRRHWPPTDYNHRENNSVWEAGRSHKTRAKLEPEHPGRSSDCGALHVSSKGVSRQTCARREARCSERPVSQRKGNTAVDKKHPSTPGLLRTSIRERAWSSLSAPFKGGWRVLRTLRPPSWFVMKLVTRDLVYFLQNPEANNRPRIPLWQALLQSGK